MKATALLVLIGLLTSWTGDANAISVAYVDSAGRQWADLNDTTGSSWYAGADYCPTDGVGACVGSLEGWTWATRDQVVQLFEELTGLSGSLFANSVYREVNAAWAPTAMTLVRPNFVGGSATPWRDIYGVTATRADNSVCSGIRPPLPGHAADERCAYGAGIEDWYRSDIADAVFAGQLLEPGRSNEIGADPEAGLFLFRVPEPGTAGLLGLGIAVLGLVRRRQASTQVHQTVGI